MRLKVRSRRSGTGVQTVSGVPVPFIGMHISRWTDRVPHPFYIRSLAFAEKWRQAGCELIVVAHGRKELDQHVTAAVSRGDVKLVDVRGQTNGFSTPLVAKCLEHGISAGYPHIGILDDDACYDSPDVLVERVRTVMGIWHPLSVSGAAATSPHNSGKPVGAMGPLTPYKFHAVYKGQSQPGHWPLAGSTWTTTGSQIVSREAAVSSQEIWGPLMPRLQHRPDISIYMSVHAAGYTVREAQIDGFRHKCGFGSETCGMSEGAYRVALRKVLLDYRIMIRWFSTQENGAFYADQLKKLASNEIQHYNRATKKSGTDGWAIPLATGRWDALARYCDDHGIA